MATNYASVEVLAIIGDSEYAERDVPDISECCKYSTYSLNRSGAERSSSIALATARWHLSSQGIRRHFWSRIIALNLDHRRRLMFTCAQMAKPHLTL